MSKSKSMIQAELFVDAVKNAGWSIVRATGSVVTICKDIEPNNNKEFCDADMEYYGLLELAPGKGGSIWGTDGGGIGALSAMRSGSFVMNKSGVQARFINALKKII